MNRLLTALVLINLVSATAFAEDAVVARVNGTSITSNALDIEVDRLIPLSTYHSNVSEEKRREFKEKALNNLIDRELQYEDAMARGLKPDKKLVKARMEQVRDSYKTKKEYKAALEQAGLTEGSLQALVERGALVQAVIELTVTKPSRISDEALKQRYEKNMDKFKQPESVKLKLITLSDEKKAAEALAKIKAGEDFGSVASRMSEDSFRIMGGDVGYQHRGRLLPEIEAEAFALKPGELSGLIKAEKNWFIIRVEEKLPERLMTFEESKDKLRKDVEKQRSDELMEKWMTGLRAKAKIEVFLKMEDTEQSSDNQTTERQKPEGK